MDHHRRTGQNRNHCTGDHNPPKALTGKGEDDTEGNRELHKYSLETLRLFLLVGKDENDVVNMDLWQFYGYLKLLRKFAKERVKQQYFQDKVLELLYILGTAWGLKSGPEEFFKGEKEIEDIFLDKDEKEDMKTRDPLAGEGEYVDMDGEQVWVYTFDAIQDIKSYIGKANRGG